MGIPVSDAGAMVRPETPAERDAVRLMLDDAEAAALRVLARADMDTGAGLEPAMEQVQAAFDLARKLTGTEGDA